MTGEEADRVEAVLIVFLIRDALDGPERAAEMLGAIQQLAHGASFIGDQDSARWFARLIERFFAKCPEPLRDGVQSSFDRLPRQA